MARWDASDRTNLSLVVVLTVTFGAALIGVDGFDRFADFVSEHEDWEVDEIFSAALAGLIAYSLVSLHAARRNYRRLGEQMLRREAAEARSQELIDQLAVRNAELERITWFAAHELREPVRSFVTHAQLIGRDSRANAEQLATALQAARHLDRLMLGLNQYMVSERALLRFEPVDCSAVLAVVLEMLAAPINDTKAEIAVGELPMIHGNASQLHTVLTALIDNALKFVPPGTRPRIRVSARRDGAVWVISVADNGIGILPRDREKVFSLVPYLHPRGLYPGNGMGLAVCRRLVTRMGGHIWVESGDNGGSVFFFTLPTQEQGLA